MANLSILGLYNYDNGIFDLLRLPEELDKDIVIDNILMECAELEVLFTDPDFLKVAIGSWSKKELSVWEKLYETTQYEYNPIWNKDGKVIETENESSSDKGTNTGVAQTNVDTSSDNQHKVSAFNAESSSLANEDVIEGESKSATVSKQEVGNEGNRARTYQRIEQGNIGITTTQSMIKEEREIDLFNIYDAIVSSFKNRFCLLVY